MLRLTQKSRRLLIIAIAVLATLLVIWGIYWIVAKNRGAPDNVTSVLIAI